MDTKDKVKKEILILSIDTSCDETSASVTRNLSVLSNVISSQIELHKKYGGVVPLVAKRAHEERIGPVITEALKRSK
jgi:N6-L-threonylcarbamoyladenine synthase